MKALCWHGKKDIRCDTVPDPQIEDPRDAIIKVTQLRHLRLRPAPLRRLHAGHEVRRHHGPRVHGRGGRGRRREQEAQGRRPRRRAVHDQLRRVRAVPARQLLGLRAHQPQQGRSADKVFGHTTAGLFGYTHLTGGYAGGQAEYVRVPYADVGAGQDPRRPDRRAGAVPRRHLPDRLAGGGAVRHPADRHGRDLGRRAGRPVRDPQRASCSAPKQVIAIDNVPERLDMARGRRRDHDQLRRGERARAPAAS